MDGTPRFLNEVDALTNMIWNVKDRALQTLEKETDIFTTPFSFADIQWLMKNHYHFTISLIGSPGQTDNHYSPPNEFLSYIC